MTNEQKKYILNNYFGDPGAQVRLGDLVIDTKVALEQSLGNGIVLYTSSAGTGAAATEAMTVTGLAANDTILSVHQSAPGTEDEPLVGWSTQADNTLTGIWPAAPGAGAIIKVLVKKA